VTTRMLPGPRVLRVEWVPGADRLRGTCFCGATHDAEDPIAMWEWLLDHRDSHGGCPVGSAPDVPIAPRREPVLA
jgi:hypothetical protein